MESELLCNYNKCRKPINCQAWVTSCSHIFCYDDGLRELEKALICPACQTQLPGKYDAIKIDLDLSEQYKSMLLAGHRPETILDVCSRAISFWTYQVHQEIVYQEYMFKKSKEKQKQFEKYYEDILDKAKKEIQRLNEELSSTKQELDSYRKKVAELSEKLTERNRHYQKLQALYEALRRKFINSNFFEKKQTYGNNVPSDRASTFGIASANDILFSAQSGSGRSSKSRYAEPGSGRSSKSVYAEPGKNIPFAQMPSAPMSVPHSSGHDYRSAVAQLKHRKYFKEN